MRDPWPLTCLASRSHPPRVPGQRQPLRVEKEHLHGSQHHRGQALDRPGQGVLGEVGSTAQGLTTDHPCSHQSGDIEIVNHKTKDRCQLKFVPYSYFSKEAARKVTGSRSPEPRRARSGVCAYVSCPRPQVTGVVSDSQGKAHYVLSGSWDEQMECSKIVHSSPSSDGKQKTVYQTLPAKLLWRKYPLP